MRARFEAAQEIARHAGGLAQARFAAARTGPVSEDFRTASSQAVERAIVAQIAERFPRDTAYGEEFGGVIGDPLWVIDPIDGVMNFERRIPLYSISIAVVSAGETEIGVVYDPVADELFAASRGNGASVNGRPMHGNDASDPRQSCIGFGYSRRTSPEQYLHLMRRLVDAGVDHRRFSSAAMMLAHVADGRLDGFFEAHLHSWDALAGLLLCKEAGLAVSTFPTDDRLRAGAPALACPSGLWPALHELLMEPAYA